MRRLWPALVFLAVVALAAVLGRVIESGMRDSEEAAVRAQVRALAEGVRLRLESRIAANMQIAEGLATYVAAHPDLTTGDFSSLAGNLLRHRSEIRSIALARDTTIVATHPLQGNEAVVGVDYRDVPEQWASVRQVRDTRRPVVAGPVPLIQGGTAIIGRTPIFLNERREVVSEDGVFWGLTSIPIDIDALFAYAGLTPSLPLEVALRGVDGRGADGAVFHGAAETFLLRRPEVLTVHLPGGTWQMAVAPLGGWPQGNGAPGGVFAAFVFGGLLMGGIGGLATARLLDPAAGQQRSGGPAVLRGREAFIAYVQRQAEERRRQGRGLALVGFDLPPEAAATVPADACIDACQAALRPDDAVGPLGPGRYAVVLGGAGEAGAAVATDFLRRALNGLDVAAAKAVFASVVVGPEDADGIAAVGRLEQVLKRA